MSLPRAGVLSAIVSVVDNTDKEPNSADSVYLELGSLDSVDGLHPNWGRFALLTGDLVLITVHDDH